MSLDTALNVPGGTLVFTTGGDYAWFEVGPPDTHDGVAAGQACLAEAVPGDEAVPIFDGELCYVETTVTGPKTINFWWKVSSEFDYDFLKFFEKATSDEISSAVHIQRGLSRGIYNEVTESQYTHYSSPADTEWNQQLSTVPDPTVLTYTDWETAISNNPPGMIGTYMYMHIISEDRYFMFEFSSWTVAGGGGFTYDRTEITPPGPPGPTVHFVHPDRVAESVSGDVDWEEKTYDLPLAVVYTLRWEYSKDASASDLKDTAWLDEVQTIPYVPPPLPGKAIDPDPADDATAILVSKILSWTAGTDVTSHDVYFDTSYPPTSKGNQPGTTYVPPVDLNYGDTYYWRIDEVNITGTTTGDDWTFDTEIPPVPNPAYNPDPANSATGIEDEVTLAWNAGTYATSHDVYFGATTPLGINHGSPDFKGNQVGTSYDLEGLSYTTIYYWRIDEVNDTGTTIGTEWSFTTKVAGPAEFSGIPTSGDVPLLVNFTDLTDPVPITWLWDFGVGTGEGTSSLQNPSHTYNTPGNFNVDLKAYTSVNYFDRNYYQAKAYRKHEGAGVGGEIFHANYINDPYLHSTLGTSVWRTSQNLIWDDDASKDYLLGYSIGSTTWAADMCHDGRDGDEYDRIYFIGASGSPTYSLSKVYRINHDGSIDEIWDLSDYGYFTHIAWDWSTNGLLLWTDDWLGVPPLLRWNWAYLTHVSADGTGVVGRWAPFPDGGAGFPGGNYPVRGACSFSSIGGSYTNQLALFRNDSGWSNTRFVLFSTFFGIPDKILDAVGLLPDPGGSVFACEDNAYAGLIISYQSFCTRWNVDDNTLENLASYDNVVPKAVCDPLDSQNWVYFGPGLRVGPNPMLLQKRYNWGTSVWETWNGDLYSEELKPHYIHAGTTPLPDPATDPDPSDGEDCVAIDKTLSWTAGAGADSHNVYFGTSPSPSEVSHEQVGTTYDPGILDYITTYYWRIDEVNGSGTTSGDEWIFEVVPPLPGKATVPDPSDGATSVLVTKILSWTAGSDATSHNVYFGTSPSPSEVSHEQVAITYDPGTMLDNTVYYWHIDEVNYCGGVTAGDEWTFRTRVPGIDEDLLIEVTDDTLIEIEEFYFKNEIIFSDFDPTLIPVVDTYVNLAIRGKQFLGTPNTFPLIILIKLGSYWYSLDGEWGADGSTITFGSDWSTFYREHILSTKLTYPQIYNAKIAIIPRDDLGMNGVAISEVKLFSIEPTYELFDVSLKVSSNETHSDSTFPEKKDYVKVYKSSHEGFYGGKLYGSGLYGG